MAEGDNLDAAIAKLTEAIERQIQVQKDWRISLRNGLLAGLGGVIGATVLVSILIAVLQPFKKLEAFGPMIERLDRTLEQGNKR